MTAIANTAQPAPDFSLDSSQGRISLSSYRGKSNVALYFMREFSCAMCTQRVVNLKKLSAALKARNTEILIVGGGSLEEATRFAKRLQLPFPVLADPNRNAYGQYNLEKVFGLLQRHGLIVVDQRGLLRFAHTAANPMVGFSQADLEREIAAL